jgi:octaprenyl-diphosphate synthase
LNDFNRVTKTNTHNSGLISAQAGRLRRGAAPVDVRQQPAYGLIAAHIDQVSRRITDELRSDIPAVTEMLEKAGRYRGKMLRPVLVFLAGQATGSLGSEHTVIATVAEMIHLAALVHDDVLDEAELRRGGPTINSLRGNEAAVMLGDLLFSHAYRLCGSLTERWLTARMAATTVAVCEGELTQLCCRDPFEMTEAKYLQIVERKTASLMAACCYLGARLAGGSEALCQGLDSYGLNLGVAYQIVDDLIDLTGDETRAGKSLQRDLATRKITLAHIHFLRQASDADRQWVKSVFLKPDEPQSARYLQRLDESGSIGYACQAARRYVEGACLALQAGMNEQSRDALRQLATGVISELPDCGESIPNR